MTSDLATWEQARRRADFAAAHGGKVAIVIGALLLWAAAGPSRARLMLAGIGVSAVGYLFVANRLALDPTLGVDASSWSGITHAAGFGHPGGGWIVQFDFIGLCAGVVLVLTCFAPWRTDRVKSEAEVRDDAIAAGIFGAVKVLAGQGEPSSINDAIEAIHGVGDALTQDRNQKVINPVGCLGVIALLTLIGIGIGYFYG